MQTTMCKIDKQQGVSHSTGNYNCLWYTEKILNTMLYTIKYYNTVTHLYFSNKKILL